MTYRELLKNTEKRFREAAVECGDFIKHSEDFLLQVLELSRKKLLLENDATVEASAVQLVEKTLERRVAGEPLQYIVGYAWFWKSKFNVGPGVLIPRRETEHVVEHLLTLSGTAPFKVAELGPGSGNIGLSVLQEKPHWAWYGYEINPDTLQYLTKNVNELKPSSSRYEIIPGDFLEKVDNEAPFDIVVSNPPYISETEFPTLSKEVRREPRLALWGGKEGMETIDKFCRKAFQILKPGGLLVFEIGSDQGEKSRAVLVRHGFKDVDVLKDMAGLDRVAVARKGIEWMH